MHSPPSEAPYVFSIRGIAGAGAGAGGIAVDAGVQGDTWLSPFVGIGGRYATWAAGPLFGGEDDTQDLGLSLVLRTARRGSYAQFSVGLGYGWGTRRTSDLFCLDACAPPTSRALGGVTFDFTAALLFHPGGVEIGPAFTLETTSWSTTLATLDLALGFAL